MSTVQHTSSNNIDTSCLQGLPVDPHPRSFWMICYSVFIKWFRGFGLGVTGVSVDWFPGSFSNIFLEEIEKSVFASLRFKCVIRQKDDNFIDPFGGSARQISILKNMFLYIKYIQM